MSGVLHPVGPEPAQTYWLRRALVIGAFLVIVAIVIALVVNRNPGTQAVPAAPTSDTVSPRPTSSPSSTAGTVSPASPEASERSSTATTAKATTDKTKSSDDSPAAKESAGPTVVQAINCNPAELRTTLTGKKRLKPDQDNTFTMSLINAAKSTCVATVYPSVFELKIYSGKDRIWSTNDCTTLVKPFRAILATEKAIEWKITWDGRRSAKGCKDRPEIPKRGTYFATAQLSGAKPVQLRMILRD